MLEVEDVEDLREVDWCLNVEVDGADHVDGRGASSNLSCAVTGFTRSGRVRGPSVLNDMANCNYIGVSGYIS